MFWNSVGTNKGPKYAKTCCDPLIITRIKNNVSRVERLCLIWRGKLSLCDIKPCFNREKISDRRVKNWLSTLKNQGQHKKGVPQKMVYHHVSRQITQSGGQRVSHYVPTFSFEHWATWFLIKGHCVADRKLLSICNTVFP